MPNDPVNHPGHYTRGQIEVWDFIVAQDLNYLRGNAVKYIVRAGVKNPALETEDLDKAIAYLKREYDECSRERTRHIRSINKVPTISVQDFIVDQGLNGRRAGALLDICNRPVRPASVLLRLADAIVSLREEIAQLKETN